MSSTTTPDPLPGTMGAPTTAPATALSAATATFIGSSPPAATATATTTTTTTTTAGGAITMKVYSESQEASLPQPQPSSASASVPNSNTKTTTNTTTNKKRPYRRTKRPKNYCDKSTISTCTTGDINNNNNVSASALLVSVNVYDAVLAESRDLLTAAQEAQQLGRLKMAAAYQLLLHARLVGLGKRFDKATVAGNNNTVSAVGDTVGTGTGTDVAGTSQGGDDTAAVTPAPPLELQPPMSLIPIPGTPGTATATATDVASAQNQQDEQQLGQGQAPLPLPPLPLLPPPTPTTAAARQLAKLLPPTCELDQIMMEHLAKAAAELHAQRSGRKRQLSQAVGHADNNPDYHHNHHNHQAGVSHQMLTPDQFFAQTANQLQMPNAANVNPGIAWSAADVKQLTAAQETGKSPKEIAGLVNKSEQQVKAFIRNQTARSKVEADCALELPLDHHADQHAKKKSGGRGRKPATTAISTVPNAVCDARTLLQGKGIPKLSK
jgi:hypothetical protein